jgi:HTH-type transcriptional regulator/antitoxin MqsA
MQEFVCQICGGSEYSVVDRPFTAQYAGVPITLDKVGMRECLSCGESLLSPLEASNISKAIKAIARSRHALLEPQQIVAIRRKHGLSQKELEHLFGLGEKVVTRWERGIVLQSRTADLLLRLMDNMPAVVGQLRDFDKNLTANKVSHTSALPLVVKAPQEVRA